MSFETFFRLISYAAVFCGFLSLWVSGSLGAVVSVVFLSLMVAAWLLEDTRWQISEKLGTALIVLALPVFIVAWRLQWISVFDIDTEVAGILARLILSLSAIKLLQQKSSRDWVFLYLMSFFEVMLGAGLSISGLYLLSFIVYVVVIVCAIIALEIRKTAMSVEANSRASDTQNAPFRKPATRLPVTSLILIVFIAFLAVPLFFMLPRVGGAGLGSRSDSRPRSGFSERVSLGGSGEIEEDDSIVMRVRLDRSDRGGMYFRGTAFDTFDNLSWEKSSARVKLPYDKGERDAIQIDSALSRDNLTVQTIYLEPLKTSVLFALPKAVVVQGSFNTLYKDLYGAISFQGTNERVSYRVVSDRSTPSVDKLRSDKRPYAVEKGNYLQLPEDLDERIGHLAYRITEEVDNRYDKAKAIETYLRGTLGYTLQRRAGGRDPLSDFLFNVREGHCEYFATAMAVMLRTQGIASRVVNGFQGGEYNDAADITIVRARNAHAWVEVFFPGEDAWVTFDPTPPAGLVTASSDGGLAGTLKKYAEAIETLWIQYFVAFDDQEQRSLAKTMRSGMAGLQAASVAYMDIIREALVGWWSDIRGADGGQAMAYAASKGLGVIAAVLIVLFAGRRSMRWLLLLPIWNKFWNKENDGRKSMVDFYEQMLTILEDRGIKKESFQTPLEFAAASNIREAVLITDQYNKVRFGNREVSLEEAKEVDRWLQAIKG